MRHISGAEKFRVFALGFGICQCVCLLTSRRMHVIGGALTVGDGAMGAEPGWERGLGGVCGDHPPLRRQLQQGPGASVYADGSAICIGSAGILGSGIAVDGGSAGGHGGGADVLDAGGQDVLRRHRREWLRQHHSQGFPCRRRQGASSRFDMLRSA
eukprot:82473-Rhodomonas_salina.3